MANFLTEIKITALDEASKNIKKVQDNLEKVKGSTSKLSAAFENYKKSTEGVARASEEFFGKLRTIALLGVGAGVSIFGFSKHLAESSESLLNASQRAGVSVESLQRLRYAAKISGIEIGEMDSALKFLNKSMAEALSNKKSEQAKAFKSLGVSIKDANGHLKAADQLFLEISDKFKKAPNDAKKVATALVLAGKGGTAVIPIFDAGSKAIKGLGDEAQKLGIILSKKELEQLDEYGDNIQRLEATISGLANSIIVALVPSLNKGVLSLQKWILSNKDLIKSKSVEYFDKFKKGLSDIWQKLQPLLRGLLKFVDICGGVGNVVRGLAYIYLASLALSFGKLVFAIGKAIAAFRLVALAFLATPFGFVTTAIGLIVYAVYELYTHWDELKKAFNDPTFQASAQKFADAIIDPFGVLLFTINAVIKAIQNVKAAMSSGLNLEIPQVQGTRFSGLPDANTAKIAPSSAPPAQDILQSRWGMLNQGKPQNNQPQKLDINMKIDAEGRPKDVQASSSAPINFKANTGVMMP